MSTQSPTRTTELVVATPSPTTNRTGNEAATVDLSGDVSATPLKRVWDDCHIKKVMVGDKEGWECAWCNKSFKPRHATRVLWHLLKLSGHGITTCKATIPKPHMDQYQMLYSANVGRAKARLNAIEEKETFVVDRQQEAVLTSPRTRAAPARY